MLKLYGIQLWISQSCNQSNRGKTLCATPVAYFICIGVCIKTIWAIPLIQMYVTICDRTKCKGENISCQLNSFDDYPMSWKPDLSRTTGAKYLALAQLLENDIKSGSLKAGDRIIFHEYFDLTTARDGICRLDRGRRCRRNPC